MILRFFFLFGLVLMGVTAYFIVIQQPPAVQLSPSVAEVTRFQEEGILPTGDIEENDEVEHGIFEVPEKDEEMLAIAMENMGDMPGMDMSGMDMADGTTMDMSNGGTMDMAEGTTMDMSNGGTMDMAEGTTMDMSNGGTMDMAEGTTMDMSNGGTMDMAEGTTMDMSNGGTMDMAEGTTMDMSNGGTMDMAEGTTMDMSNGGTMDMAAMEPECEGGGGLNFCPDAADVDREITLSMREWSFDQMEINVKAGERIRFTVKNEGNVLHEFMFMTMPLMQAVNYRAMRADWSLLEHEALFEKSLLLPGQDLSFVVEVQADGAWMFMCMLPYHMQMGMMGQMATPGMAMDMEM